jgi:Fur family transcriptional regulator, ferric uptake regulator
MKIFFIYPLGACPRVVDMALENAIGKLRSSGHKVTPQRLAVIEAIAVEQHQNLEGIRTRCPEVGMVTVYRTLDLFSELGLVRRLDLGDGPRYELAEDHHHHLICEDCGSVKEFEQCPLDLKRLPRVGGRFKIRAHSLEVYGTCSDCSTGGGR